MINRKASPGAAQGKSQPETQHLLQWLLNVCNISWWTHTQNWHVWTKNTTVLQQYTRFPHQQYRSTKNLMSVGMVQPPPNGLNSGWSARMFTPYNPGFIWDNAEVYQWGFMDRKGNRRWIQLCYICSFTMIRYQRLDMLIFYTVTLTQWINLKTGPTRNLTISVLSTMQGEAFDNHYFPRFTGGSCT